MFSIIVLLPIYGQQNDNIWLMGYNYDQSDNAIEGSYLSFTNNQLEVTPEALLLDLQSSSISISDAFGSLQFYTNGCSVVNYDHEVIENGTGINPGETHNDYCVNNVEPWREYYPGGKQSVLALPAPETDSVYYLIHEANEIIVEANGNLRIAVSPLYYSKVDMRYNGGRGRVVTKNIPILEEEAFFGQLTAVKKTNGIDWWIVKPSIKEENTFYFFTLNESGIELSHTQEIGINHTNFAGWANFSPDGTKYARYEPTSYDLLLYDFNRETGLLSNFQQIAIEEEEEWVGGVAFSPSSRFLYVSSYDFIYQYDTWAEDIAASRITVAEYEYQGEFLEDNFWGMQLGPDCRLYIFCNSCDVIHVIHNPDEPGLACDFEQAAVQLLWPIFRSQPHFPNYRLGPVGNEGLPCSPVVSVQETIVPMAGVKIFPNPATQQITLSTQGVSGTWVLYDGLGRAVATANLENNASQVVDVTHLISGLYYWNVLGTKVSGKMVKQ
jgi:hypothetical protein